MSGFARTKTTRFKVDSNGGNCALIRTILSSPQQQQDFARWSSLLYEPEQNDGHEVHVA
jgi:hypothetical protein